MASDRYTVTNGTQSIAVFLEPHIRSGMPTGSVGWAVPVADMRRFGDVVSFRAELYGFGVSIGDDAAGREAAAGEGVERSCGNVISEDLLLISAATPEHRAHHITCTFRFPWHDVGGCRPGNRAHSRVGRRSCSRTLPTEVEADSLVRGGFGAFLGAVGRLGRRWVLLRSRRSRPTSAAIGEVVERYCCNIVSNRLSVWAVAI